MRREETLPSRTHIVRPKSGWAIEASEVTPGIYYRIAKNSAVDMRAAIAETRAIHASAYVHNDWDIPEAKSPHGHGDVPEITPHYATASAHAFALVGDNSTGFIVQILSDAVDHGDAVAKVYRKSLLYLVSCALEADHKTPLLSLANTADPKIATDTHWQHATIERLKKWHARFPGGADPSTSKNLGELVTAHVSITTTAKANARHGVFDNSIDIVDGAIRSILGVGKTFALPRKVDDLDY